MAKEETVTLDTEATIDATTTDTMSGMQVEIPYVPASQRTRTEAVEDSIVVVGQARQKKRKRTKVATDTVEVAPSAEGSATKKARSSRDKELTGHEDGKGAVSGLEPFDFSAVPNILDDNPNIEDGKKKQRKTKPNRGASVLISKLP